jgi:hypothetical protein
MLYLLKIIEKIPFSDKNDQFINTLIHIIKNNIYQRETILNASNVGIMLSMLQLRRTKPFGIIEKKLGKGINKIGGIIGTSATSLAETTSNIANAGLSTYQKFEDKIMPKDPSSI